MMTIPTVLCPSVLCPSVLCPTVLGPTVLGPTVLGPEKPWLHTDSGRGAGWGPLILALAAMILLCLIRPLAAQEGLMISRNQFAGKENRPRRALPPGESVEVRDEYWEAGKGEFLRIVSPDPDVAAVLRFRPIRRKGNPPVGIPPGTEELRLTVILLTRPGERTYQTKTGTQRMKAGGLVSSRRYRVGDGLHTLLAGAPGRVAEIVIQDDGQAEVILSRDEGGLALEVIPQRKGGRPHGARPWYEGVPLRFADYHFLLSGYRENLYGEVRLFDIVSGKLNYFFTDSTDLVLGRIVIAQQAWRSELFSLWVEGGGGYFSEESSTQTTDEPELTYAGGVTLHWRAGSWGAAGHVSLVGEENVLVMLGGWQPWDWLGFVFTWQSFKGLSDVGLGVTMAF